MITPITLCCAVILQAGGTTMSSFAYTYNTAGNRTQVIEADGTVVTWRYDPAYQLVKMSNVVGPPRTISIYVRRCWEPNPQVRQQRPNDVQL